MAKDIKTKICSIWNTTVTKLSLKDYRRKLEKGKDLVLFYMVFFLYDLYTLKVIEEVEKKNKIKSYNSMDEYFTLVCLYILD